MASVGEIIAEIKALKEEVSALTKSMGVASGGQVNSTDLAKEESIDQVKAGIKVLDKKIKLLFDRLQGTSAAAAEATSDMKLSKTFFEINSKKTFIKFKADTFHLGMVLCSAVRYDKEKNDNKVEEAVDCFVNIWEMMALARDVQFGIFQKRIEAEREKGNQYPESVYVFQGGKSESAAKRNDKKALSRILEIKPSNSEGKVLFNVKSGPGHTDSHGLIVPEYGARPEKQILVQANYATMQQLAAAVQTNINGYVTAQYVDQSSEYYYMKQKK